MKAIQYFFLSLICLIGLTGCGYTTSSTLPASLRSVYIDTFENKISFTTESRRNLYLPLLEVNVRNAISDRFLFDGNVRVADKQSADMFLRGELLNYRRVGLRFTESDDVEEYRVYITVALELINNNTGETMWTEQAFIGEATYFVSGSQATTEDVAVEEAIQDLARRIVERTVEDW